MNHNHKNTQVQKQHLNIQIKTLTSAPLLWWRFTTFTTSDHQIRSMNVPQGKGGVDILFSHMQYFLYILVCNNARNRENNTAQVNLSYFTVKELNRDYNTKYIIVHC